MDHGVDPSANGSTVWKASRDTSAKGRGAPCMRACFDISLRRTDQLDHGIYIYGHVRIALAYHSTIYSSTTKVSCYRAYVCSTRGCAGGRCESHAPTRARDIYDVGMHAHAYDAVAPHARPAPSCRMAWSPSRLSAVKVAAAARGSRLLLY